MKYNRPFYGVLWTSLIPILLYCLFVFEFTSCVPSMQLSKNRNPFIGQAPSGVPPAKFLSQNFAAVGTKQGNTMSITVNGSNCGSQMYLNQPCVSVTLCSIKDSSICQTISNILLDTGSNGLRVFKSVIDGKVLSGLMAVSSGNNLLGECITYGDGSSQWGQVTYSYVQLGQEPLVAIPIHLIDFGFGVAPSPCQSPNSNPDMTPKYFNGILGVGTLAQDCGGVCVTSSQNNIYYTCFQNDCNSGAYVELGAQVINPVAALPVDNQGVSITLPSVGNNGTSFVTGTMTIGISGSPTTSVVLNTDSDGYFITNSGSSYDSNSLVWLEGFMDSGSNFLYFPSKMNLCTTESYKAFYCPSSQTPFTYTNTNKIVKTFNRAETFTVYNYETLTAANPQSKVFSNLAGGLPSSVADKAFDWGLPFFFGRTIYVGISGKDSPLGKGPYFAY